MKTLYMVRHGKAKHGSDDVSRVLAKKGRHAIEVLGERLAQQSIILQKIISSSAERAKQTALILSEQIGYDPKQIDIAPELYNGSLLTIFEVINALDPQYDSVMLVGHNPGFSDFANVITSVPMGILSPGGIVCVRFDIDDWQLVAENTGEFADIDSFI